MAHDDRVETWFEEWIVSHLERIPRSDWPELGSEYWETVRSSFVHHGVKHDVAIDASRLMAESPPPFLDKHLESFLKHVKTVWALSEVTPDAPAERETAKAASRDCDDCYGDGLTVRFRKLSVGKIGASGKPLPDRIVCYCRCPMGRWTEKRHREGNDEAKLLRKRITDLADYHWLWGLEYRSPPGTPALAIRSDAPTAKPVPQFDDDPIF